MTLREEIQKYLNRLKKPYPETPHELALELNERQALMPRATELKAQAQTALDKAKKAATVPSGMSVSQYKDAMNAEITDEREVLDLATGLHSDLVHSCDVGRTLVSMEKQYMRSFPETVERKGGIRVTKQDSTP